MRIPWLGFLIPGVLFTVVGVASAAIWGPGPLSIGAVVSGLLLCLAAGLQARHDVKDGGRPR